jgi:L-ascorbate metabolism protein UlaG (beta-lactamase superfamily)
MEITWYGHSCFRLAERGKATIVTDPFGEHVGYPLPKMKADVVTISHDAPGHNNATAIKTARRVLTGPGEYEIGGVFIFGVAMHTLTVEPPKKNVAYLYDFDGLTVAHLGDLDHIPTQSMVEQLGNVHVALVPVGGGGGLNATQAVELISLLEPNYVIPMHYHTDESRLGLEPLDRFLREMGVNRVQQEQTFKPSLSGLPEQTQIVVMDVSR